MENYILHRIYAGYGKIVKKLNFSFQKNLQICCRLFFHMSYIFSFIYQKRFYKNQKFNFFAKIYQIR